MIFLKNYLGWLVLLQRSWGGQEARRRGGPTSPTRLQCYSSFWPMGWSGFIHAWSHHSCSSCWRSWMDSKCSSWLVVFNILIPNHSCLVSLVLFIKNNFWLPQLKVDGMQLNHQKSSLLELLQTQSHSRPRLLGNNLICPRMKNRSLFVHLFKLLSVFLYEFLLRVLLVFYYWLCRLTLNRNLIN